MNKPSWLSVGEHPVRRHIVVWGTAVLIGVLVPLFQLGTHWPWIALFFLLLVGVTLAFFYQTWVLSLLLLLVIPTSDAQLTQTPFLIPGTNFAISYVDPLLILIFAFWFFALARGQKKVYSTVLNLPFLLFLITICYAVMVGLLTGARPGDVWIALRPPLMYFLAFVATTAFVSSRQVINLMTLLLGAIWAVSVWGIYVSVTGQGTAVSTAFGTLALRNFQGAQNAYLVIGFLLVLSCLMFARRPWVRWVLAGVASCIGAAVLLSFVRGNWVGTAVGLAVILVMLPAAWRLRFIAVISGVVLTFMVLVAVAVALSPQNAPLLQVARERLLSIFDPTASTPYTLDAAQSRLFELQSGLPQVLEAPFIGHGYGHYFWVNFVRGELTQVRGFHNSYLTLAYTNGFIGLLAFLWLCAAFVGHVWFFGRFLPLTIERGIVTGLTAAFVAILVASLVNFYLFDMVNLAPFLGVSMGIVLFLLKRHGKVHISSEN